MKTSTKKRVASVLDKIVTILKCGGPGGTPGPCPTGGQSSKEISKKAHEKSVNAHAETEAVANYYKKSGQQLPYGVSVLLQKSQSAKTISGGSTKPHEGGFRDHEQVYLYHKAARDVHAEVSKAHKSFGTADKEERSFHQNASKEHKAASEAHASAARHYRSTYKIS